MYHYSILLEKTATASDFLVFVLHETTWSDYFWGWKGCVSSCAWDWDAFSPTPPGLGFPLSLSTTPLFLSPHLPLWSSAPFFYGGGGARQAGFSLTAFRLDVCVCVCVCCSAVHPQGSWGRRRGLSLRLSDQVHILRSITPPGPASLINLQCSPIVSEYFVFVQSGEFPASCMCQGVCAPGSLPVSSPCCLPAFFTWRIVLCTLFAMPSIATSIFGWFHALMQCNATPVNQSVHHQTKMLT